MTDLLGIEHPIILAGMGNISLAELVAAVSNAGGLGVLGGGFLPPDEIRKEIRRVKELTDKPYAVDLLVAEGMPGVEDLLRVLYDEGVRIFLSGLGNPGALVKEMHGHDMIVIAMIGNTKHARRCVEAGVDGLVAQGTEAGGHTGRVATMPLVPAVVDAVKPLPVAAAGGIGDGRGLVAALSLGASAAVVGTRFVATREARSHEAYKQRIVTANEEDTMITKGYTGKSCRVIRNTYAESWIGREDEIEPFPAQLFKHWDKMQAAVEGGDTDIGIMPAGQVSGLVRGVESAADVVRDMMTEAERILDELGALRAVQSAKR
jgi:enoyl-[acyl-carrier protein] reductase II